MLAEFYDGCEIFITGGSGAVGKAAIEKLLRSCDVKRIYILLRIKKDQSVEQRLENIKSSKIFRVLKAEKPNELKKLVAIPGDAELPILGITPCYAKIMENVSIFFHCAATVRFNEALKIAAKLNVGGTWEALKFAESLKKLKIFLHVSTFFSNPYLEKVESKMYTSPIDWKLFLQMMEDDKRQELFNALTKKITMGFPNTYCFTKNLAESVVNGYRNRLPVAIFRPSIVVASLIEPEPGFPPSLMGAMGLFVLVGAGLLKSVNLNQDIILDMTPLDIGTSVMLTWTYLAAKQYEEGYVEEIPVLLTSSYNILKTTFKELAISLQEDGIWRDNAFNKTFLIPHCYFITNKYLYNLLVFTHQIVPSLLVDGLLFLFGRKPVLMGLVRKGYTSLEIMRPFLFNNYRSDYYLKHQEILDITKNTNFDMSESLALTDSAEGLRQHCKSMVLAIREVLLNEDPATIPRANRILTTKIVLYNAIRAVLAYYILRWFYRIIYSYLDL